MQYKSILENLRTARKLVEEHPEHRFKLNMFRSLILFFGIALY
jgi:hypothetical protein